MKILLLCIGKTSESYLQKGIDIYKKRLKHYCSFDLVVLKDVKVSKDKTNLLKDEADVILNYCKPEDTVILLDELGKPYTSEGFASFMERHMVQATRRLVFVIGGAYGFAPTIYERANGQISFSTFTFSHQMIRLFFVEQLYRAYTIIRNEKYHNP